MSYQEKLPSIQWRDEYPSSGWVPASAQASPGLENYTIGGVETRKYAFNGANTEERLSSSFEIPHDYMPGGQIEVHVHFRPTTTGTGNVKWFFDWEFSKANTSVTVTPVAPDSQTSLETVFTIPASTQYYHYISAFGFLPENGYVLGDKIGFTLRRTPADEEDTYEADVILEQVAAHVPIDSAGSYEIYSK